MVELNGWKEADVAIEGQPLTIGESMTLRVALSMFLGFIDVDGLSESENALDKGLADGYRHNTASILKKMMAKNSE